MPTARVRCGSISSAPWPSAAARRRVRSGSRRSSSASMQSTSASRSQARACVGRVCVWRARGVRVACAELLVCEGCSLYPPYPPYSPYSPCPPCYIPHALYSLGDEAFLEIAREGMRETTEGCPEGWARYTYIYVYICAQMDLLRWYACCTYCVLAALTH